MSLKQQYQCSCLYRLAGDVQLVARRVMQVIHCLAVAEEPWSEQSLSLIELRVKDRPNFSLQQL